MDRWNGSFVTGFILLGLTGDQQAKTVLFVVFLFIYLFIVTGNFILLTLCIHEPRLHTPMYFFIGNLSFLDIFYSSVFLPNLLVHLCMDNWSISFSGCAAQIYLFVVLSSTESVFLSVMAFDRYVAICFPLHYSRLINSSTCSKMVAACWLTALLMALPVTVLALSLPLCGSNIIDHFFCDVITIVKMACVDIVIVETVIYIAATIVIFIPFIIILLSYVHIIVSILKIRSSQGRKKAFSTCASHLINILLIYVACIFVNTKLLLKNTEKEGKMLSMFHTVGPPLWNPIIYSLRNKEIKLALQNLMKRAVSFSSSGGSDKKSFFGLKP